MKDRLDDAIELTERLIEYYAVHQTKFTEKKNYENAKRVHLMGRGVEHVYKTLLKLRKGQIEVL